VNFNSVTLLEWGVCNSYHRVEMDGEAAKYMPTASGFHFDVVLELAVARLSIVRRGTIGSCRIDVDGTDDDLPIPYAAICSRRPWISGTHSTKLQAMAQ
jgi:hypothetical protein